MRYKLKSTCTKQIPKVVTAIAMAGSVSLIANVDKVSAENLNQTENLDENQTIYKEPEIDKIENLEEFSRIVEEVTINEVEQEVVSDQSVENKNNAQIGIDEYKEKNGWVQEADTWYYYKNGTKATGWLKDGESWYWLKSDGKMASNEWLNLNGTWYWLKSSGRMASNEWIKENGYWYCFKQSGAMYSEEWVKHKGYWYWLKLSGKMSTDEWIKDKGEWYWLESDGKMSSNEWVKHRGSWYWLKSGGKMANNEILKVNGVWYRFDNNGKMDSKTNFKVGQVKPVSSLNIRSGASTSYKVIAQVYSNEYVEILDSTSGWYKVKIGNGTIGWASSSYINVINSSNASGNEQSSESTNSSKIQRVINIAKDQLGKPYGWGAEGPNSFDCSGLTYYAYKNGAGVTLPRTSAAQATAGRAVSKSDLKPGDLVFFNTNGQGISHVGIYIGGGNMIHSTKPGDVVKTTSINSSYYSSRYVTARRIVE